MALSQAELQLLLTAKDQASKVMDTAGKSSDGFGKKLKALAAVAVGVVGAFASFKTLASAVSVTKELGSAVSKLSRETGLGAEGASKLLYAFKRVGLDGDDASRSLGFFSKNLLKVSEDAEDGDKALAPVSETLKKLGINALDTTGNIRPMDALLGEVSDKFKAMPDGAEKTALAMQLFGKSGKDLLPILNQGSAGLDQLGKQAEKMGLVLSTKNVADIKKFTGAQRELDAAISGVKLQIGLALMPVLTDLSGMLIDVTIKARHLVEDGIAFLHAKLLDLAPQIAWVRDKAGELNDKLGPLLQRLKDLALATIQNETAMVGLGTALGLAVLPVVGDAIGAFANLGQLIAVLPLNPVTILIAAVAGLAAGLFYLYKHSETARQVMNKLAAIAMDLGQTIGSTLNGALADAGDLLGKFVLGLQGGFAGGTALQMAAFNLGKTLRDDVIPFLKEVGEGIRLMALILAGGDVQGNIGKTQQAFVDAAREIKKSWETEIKPAIEAFGGIMAVLASEVGKFIDDIKKNWSSWEPVLRFIADFMVARIEGMVQKLHGFIEILSGIIQFVDDLMHGRWSELWEDAKLIVNGVLDVIIGQMKEMFGNIPGIIIGLAADAASAAGDFAKGIYDSAVAWVEKIPTKIRDTLNSAIAWLNSMLDKLSGTQIIPAIKVRGKTIVPGVNLPELGHIPSLASGTPFVQQDSLAFLHRGEAVIPAAQNNGGSGGVTVNMPNATIYAQDRAEAWRSMGDVGWAIRARAKGLAVYGW